MRILFSVDHDGPGGESSDFWLDTHPAAPFDALAGELDRVSGDSLHQAWWDRDRLLETGRSIGSQLLDGSALSHRATGPAGGGRRTAGHGQLVAVSGPYAGSVWDLPPGRHMVGRSDEAAVNLVRDPLVSRRHAVLAVDPSGISVQDQNSANGISVDGERCEHATLAGGALLQVGGTVLAWQTGEAPPAEVSPDGEGGLVFNRPPRMLTPDSPATVHFPGPPPSHHGVNFPLMATIAPVVLGVAIAVFAHNPLFLFFTLLSPVIGVANYWSQKRSGTRSHRDRTRDHQEALARAEEQLDAAVRDETSRRRQSFPDPGAVRRIAEGPGPSLWERRLTDTDFMALRVGSANLAASVILDGPPPGSGDRRVLRQVPAVVDLERDGVLGIAGERRAAQGLATALILQAAVLHAPDDLAVTILTGPHQAEGWAWARWLPHLREKDGRCVARIATSDTAVARLAGELSVVIDERLNSTRAKSGDGRDKPSAHLVVIDGAYQLGAVPAVTKILRRGPEAGVMAVCLDDAERLLPEECYAVALLDANRPAWLTLRTGRATRSIDVLGDLVDPAEAEQIARKLAPLRLNRRAVTGTTIPASVRLLTQLGLDPPSAGAVADGWRRSERSTQAVIGQSETGPMVVDLAADGPHGLVAGTTGSGKSEFLQTLIASLALVNRPEMINFVLVDYKGGSAFKECARLPHTVGMVTDLDGHQTERALVSVSAELRRRELLLAAVGAKDIEGYWRAAPAGDAPLGRLVIVIDEFASLVDELPGFVDGLVDLARRGRSLGLHLILATQRPSGVVSPAIKTNTNLRVAMRVTDAADSIDVIDSPLASRITKGLPGRGYARVGHEDLTEFQAARIGGRRQTGTASPVRLHPVAWGSIGEVLTTAAGPDTTDDTTDLSDLVTAMTEAAAAMKVSNPRRPWLPALPANLTLGAEALGPPPAGGPDATDSWFGVEDRPETQTQHPATFDVAGDGHLLIIGDPGSGRSTFLRTLAASLSARSRVEDVHIYGIDCGNGALSPLEAFPHVGAVVSRHEPDRVDRLVGKLMAETTERQQVLARNGYATIADQRRAAGPGDRLPYVVVLLDRWEGYTAEFELTDGGRLVNSVMHLMREGHSCGIRFVVTSDRSGTSPRFASLAERVVMMRLNDRTVYSALGLNPRHLPDAIGPGRGFYARGGTELQVGLLDDDPSGPAQVAALERLAKAAVARSRAVGADRRPDPIAVLPFHVAIEPLLEAGPVTAPLASVVVGVGGDRLEAQIVDLCRHGPGFVVAGPPRSGRSNALVAVARSVLSRGGRVLALTGRPSPLQELAPLPGVSAVLDGRGVTGAELAGWLGDGGGLTVIVDDAEFLADAPFSDALAGFARTARDHGSALIVAGTAGELGQFRGFIPEARKSKSGLLLCPSSAADGDLLGMRLPRTSLFAGPPGRGVLVAGGTVATVQVPSALHPGAPPRS